ncbi:hypothetical protein WJ62_23380 [Burkholderia diffusa]|nr:hypothetical protein WJ62_23380 [Burkholderia diffusa]
MWLCITIFDYLTAEDDEMMAASRAKSLRRTLEVDKLIAFRIQLSSVTLEFNKHKLRITREDAVTGTFMNAGKRGSKVEPACCFENKCILDCLLPPNKRFFHLFLSLHAL